MPVQFPEPYTPDACKTPESRSAFLERYLPVSVSVKHYVPNAQTAVDIRKAEDTDGRCWFFAVSGAELIYLMHLNPVPVPFGPGLEVPSTLAKNAMYQGSVWRSQDLKHYGKVVPIAQKVYWSLYGETGSNWFSDTIQSEDGHKFWLRRVTEALEKGLPVYALHCGASGLIDQVKAIGDMSEVDPYWTDEPDDSGMHWRLAICQKS